MQWGVNPAQELGVGTCLSLPTLFEGMNNAVLSITHDDRYGLEFTEFMLFIDGFLTNTVR